MHNPPRHLWLTMETWPAPASGFPQAAGLPDLLVPCVDARHRLRGPYTAAGTIMRALVPTALARSPELVKDHEVELLSVAPELAASVPSTMETLTSLAVPQERTRYYSRWRTLRLAHGLAEFLRGCALDRARPTTLLLDNLDEADYTDQEFAAVLLRRLDPGLVTVAIRTPAVAGADGVLTDALARFAHHPDLAVPVTAVPPDPATDGAGSAAAYVSSDCAAAGPGTRAAYEALPESERRALHDHRAGELAATGEFSWRLGAIPYHRQRGGDLGRALDDLWEAVDYCVRMGFYHAAVRMGEPARTLARELNRQQLWWELTSRLAVSLTALGDADGAEGMLLDARAATTAPKAHAQIGYFMAMLFTRFREPERIDHDRALGWINEAIAIAGLLPEPKERAISTVFNENGRALIESHLGRPEEALRLVSEGMERLDAELDPSEHRLHRSVLRYNRAQVCVGLGRLEEAAADYRAVIAEDPNYPEYHFDLGNLLRRLGREAEAMVCYEAAARLSPPFPELYYNRGDLLAAMGDAEAALAEFEYVLELDPGYLAAHVNRVDLLLHIGASDRASQAVTEGLAAVPGDPQLLCQRARIALESGLIAQAQADAGLAAEAQPPLPEAFALAASVAFELGDLPAALASLSRALEFGRDPVILYNRAAVLQATGDLAGAIGAFSEVLELDPTEADAWLQRGICRRQSGDDEGARADFRRFRELAPGRAGETVPHATAAQAS